MFLQGAVRSLWRRKSRESPKVLCQNTGRSVRKDRGCDQHRYEDVRGASRFPLSSDVLKELLSGFSC